jgi:hypothetical protein
LKLRRQLFPFEGNSQPLLQYLFITQNKSFLEWE